MARVDFYVLNHSGEQARQNFACRLAEKAYKLDNRVHIHAEDIAQARRLDELLWTFRDGSFVPHELLNGGQPPHGGGSPSTSPATPVTIGHGDEAFRDGDLLINLCNEIPPCAPSFERVAELVSADDDCKRWSRKRFVEYRDQGHQLETHDV